MIGSTSDMSLSLDHQTNEHQKMALIRGATTYKNSSYTTLQYVYRIAAKKSL